MSEIWYIVIIRLAFDEEDTMIRVQADTWEEAATFAERRLLELHRADEDVEAIGNGDAVCIVGYVIRCGTTEPTIEFAREN